VKPAAIEVEAEVTEQCEAAEEAIASREDVRRRRVRWCSVANGQ